MEPIWGHKIPGAGLELPQLEFSLIRVGLAAAGPQKQILA